MGGRYRGWEVGRGRMWSFELFDVVDLQQFFFHSGVDTGHSLSFEGASTEASSR